MGFLHKPRNGIFQKSRAVARLNLKAYAMCEREFFGISFLSLQL